MDTAQRSGLALSGAALQMSNDSPAAASLVMSQFLSIESIISELLWILMLSNMAGGEGRERRCKRQQAQIVFRQWSI